MISARKLVLACIVAALFVHFGCREAQPPRADAEAVRAAPAPVAAPGPGKAARIRHAGQTFDTYTVNYPREKIQFYWKDDRGNKLKSIDSLKAYVAGKGQRLVFATNAGMYMEDFTPLGLYVEGGKTLRRMNTVQKAYGNFYLQPNGVFLLTAKKAMVIPSSQYISVKEKILFATQSGPMLVIDGQLHPAFTEGSKNGNIRSGVGIDTAGRVVFAISNSLCNYYDFATLFQKVLHCNQALFLDGAISRMYLPGIERNEEGGAFGAMIATTSPQH
jgi:uncharacterized protein YigE (DUF2233 family)